MMALPEWRIRLTGSLGVVALNVVCLVGTAVQGALPLPRPMFEVASVRANTSASGGMRMDSRGDQFIAVNSPLRLLIESAYGFRDRRLIGAPEWVNTERFDIAARAPAGTTMTQKSLMLQALLEDRFRLVWRRETRQLPVYLLVLARADGAPGPSLTRSTADCTSRGLSGAAGGATPADNRPTCGMVSGGTRASGGAVTMAALADALTRSVDRVVVDRTGLSGAFDFDVRWMPETGPSLFTALQEQLGLKLEAGQGPVEVMLIDGIQQPTSD